MNLLFVGDGKGSWTMRGEQLGGALGARVLKHPTANDFAWADLVVLVKRAGPQWAHAVHQAKKPLVWDALDFWRQPDDNRLTERQSRDLLQQQIARIQPTLVIGATQAMASACNGVYLPHHTRKGLKPAPARREIKTIGYDGGVQYLGHWRGTMQRFCHKRGWRWIENPADLRSVDLLVAFRDGRFDGWMCRQWKSGVKYGNAIAAGRPIISQETSAYRELLPPGSLVTSRDDLDEAVEYWRQESMRADAVRCAALSARHLELGSIAAQYRVILAGVLEQKAVA